MTHLEIFTDGSCLGNPGPGGCAAIILDHGHIMHTIVERRGLTTNNEMELLAIFKALNWLRPIKVDKITIFTDSKYAIGVLSLSWTWNKNVLLLSKIVKEAHFNKVSFEWIRGHGFITDHVSTYNAMADELARKEAKKAKKEYR